MGDAAVRAEVSGVHGQAFGRVKGLSLTGAAVQFGVEQTTAFVSGEKATLIFHFRHERPVQVEAIVRTQTEMDGFRQFGFTFLTPLAIRAKLPPSLLRFFSERAAFRVAPDGPVPVELKSSMLDLRVSGHLRDISVDGLGVVVDEGAGKELVPGLNVSAEFTLPGQDRPLMCEALIRNRSSLKNGAVLTGLRVNRKGSLNFVSLNVTEYVMIRQRASLQARAEKQSKLTP